MLHRTLTPAELLAFFEQEKRNHPDLSELELSHLKPEESYALTKIVGAIKDGHVVGFCMVPSFDNTIVMSLYISRDHRRQSHAKELLNGLKITRLNCLADNESAMRLYESLGFEIHSATHHSIRFERKF